MKKRKTRQFKRTLLAVSAASALFLLWFAVFGKGLAVSHFQGVLDAILVVMALAAGSFLAFSFLPYFHGGQPPCFRIVSGSPRAGPCVPPSCQRVVHPGHRLCTWLHVDKP